MEEVLAAGIEITALQLLLVGVGDGMDQEVEPAPGIPQRGECGVQARRIGDVAWKDQRRAHARRLRLHGPPDCLPLGGDGEIRATQVAPPGHTTDASGEAVRRERYGTQALI